MRSLLYEILKAIGKLVAGITGVLLIAFVAMTIALILFKLFDPLWDWIGDPFL